MPKKGCIKNRLGEIGYNNFGSKMEIVLYEGKTRVKVYFERYNWTSDYVEYVAFKRGNVKCPYEPRLYGMGYFGEGKYNCKDYDRAYDTWRDMLERCYDPYYLNKYPSYIDCRVCKEWLNYQNFAQWYEENYYEVESERMHLDKDILVKGNRVYSPNKCLFVPQRINSLFIKSNKTRGMYPIGITHHKRDNVFETKCSVYKDGKFKTKYLGSFPLNRPFQAFYTYKQFKEQYIKQVADEYKDLIPLKLYEAMYSYEVEIND